MFLWIAFALALPLAAQPAVDQVMTRLAETRRFTDVAISPDGKRVAWVEDLKGGSAVWIQDLAGGEPRHIFVRGGKAAREYAPAWSPDGARLAFLSDAAKPGQAQIYVAPAAGGGPRRLTSLDGVIAAPQWSRDGRGLAFRFTEGVSGPLGPLEAAPAQTGVIDEAIHNQRLMEFDLAGLRARAVSPDSLHIYEFDWSSDGRRFAVTAAPGPGDNNWWTAKLYTVERDSGRTAAIYEPPPDRQLACPRWSPDGRQVAFIGGLMSDQSVTGGDIFLVASSGGEARNLTTRRRASPSSIRWTAPGKLLVTEWFGGGSRVARIDTSTGRDEVLWTGDEDLHSDGYGPTFSLAADGVTSAWVRAGWSAPPEVWAGPVGEWRQLTRLNAGRKPEWGPAKSLEWSNDGRRVQGWLLYPAGFSPERRYPMVVEVHGGPASSVRSVWPRVFYSAAPLAASGYFVFFPNPRGSYGQGEDFTRANLKDFGGGDLRDILAGVDRVLKIAPVDPNRIGITGWSYGGFMTMFAVTRTARFQAAVAGAGIANWQSYYGQNLIDKWMIPFFGASVYDDPAVYARASAINFVKQVKTPTLVVVGERDAECPAPQSFEYWHALKTLGVRTALVVYPGEGHLFRKPENRTDLMRRVIAWFEQSLR